jgi:tetratricopeptide (TPR) repeat protein
VRVVAQNLVRWLSAIVVLALLAACSNQPADTAKQAATNGHVGADVCAGCHASEAALWRGSHHDLAIQLATSETVLGDFADSEFEHNGVLTRFYSADDSLWVETEGADGQMAAFPVVYAFGVYPLQQYMLRLPDGKLQTLGVSWDSRPVADGGQRWFHVYGDEPIPHTDVLHWTQPSQNWETMCADCHSTGLTSRYDIADDSFTTVWSELNVACEACHGPGEKHVAWVEREAAGKPAESVNESANKDMGLDPVLSERRGVQWSLNPVTGNSMRSQQNVSHAELNACAGCHSRRSRIAEDTHPATPYLDNYMPALIEQPLYQADGQIQDEVYVYGSFLQSKMHAAGVTCSDCHDPHSLQLREPGAAVCGQCHAAATFATAEHQLHEGGEADCLDCHMPATTYMQVDGRRDHSFRIPRPQLTVAHGVANACNACHADQTAEWAVQVLAEQGRLAVDQDAAHWTSMLASADRFDQASMEALSQLAVDAAVPAIIRATAISRLRLANAPESRELIAQLASAEEPLVRLAAALALQNSQPQLAASVAPKLLDDPIRAVRIEAASALGSVDPLMLPAGSHAQVQAAIDEYIEAQLISAERPEAHVNIGNLQRMQGRPEKAEAEYLIAIELRPQFVPAYVNLADLYRDWGREPEAESIIRAGLIVLPEQAELHHALGLSLVRQKRLDAALPELKLAAESPAANARLALVYAVALQSMGMTVEAISYLEGALDRFGDEPELRNALREYTAGQNK